MVIKVRSLALLATGLASAQPVLAQQQTVSPPANSSSEDADKAGEITVTGSRISQSGYQAPTPVTVATIEQLQQAAPTSIANALNQLPQLAGSSSPRTASARLIGGTSGNLLNLRNLGPQRTLILVDGRRVPPTTFRGVVDVDTIPELLIKRVDIVTGGASAVYGSDAVTGVVNFVLDHELDGVRGLLQKGISTQGDGGSYRLGLAVGKRFADGRGHITLSAERNDSSGITYGARPLFGTNFTLIGVDAVTGAPVSGAAAGTAAAPYAQVANVFLTRPTSGNLLLVSGPAGFAGTQYTPGGAFVPYNFGIRFGGVFQVGGDGRGISDFSSLVAGTVNDNFRGEVSFEITPAVKLFAVGNYSSSKIRYAGSANAVLFSSLSGANNLPARLSPTNPAAEALPNAFLPATLAAAMTAAGTRSLVYSKSFFGMPLPQIAQDTRAYNATFGAEADLGNGWKANAYYTHSDSKQDVSQSHNAKNANLFAAIDAVRDPATGNIVCRVTLTYPTVAPGCVPFNVFDNNVSQAVVNYITESSRFSVSNKIDNVAFSVEGSPFSTWAGPVAISVGAEYRSESLLLDTNSDPATYQAESAFLQANPTAIRSLSQGTVRFFAFNQAGANASREVKEVSGELLVPLLRDVPGAQSLDLSGAVRYTDYSTSGGVTTWKIGGTYQPVDGVRFRVTRSRDIRAPSLWDLFAGPQTNIATTNDPHTGLTVATPQVITAGNPDLDPEIGDAFTAGIVLQPAFIPGLSLSIDYFDIKIRGALATTSAASVLALCEASNGTGQACALITRPLPFSDRTAANNFTSVRLAPLNLSALATRGVDFEASYRSRIGKGNLSLRLMGSYTSRYVQQQTTTSPALNAVGLVDDDTAMTFTPIPKWRGTFSATYQTGGFTINVQERYIGGLTCGYTHVCVASAKIPAVAYTDLSASYKIPSNENLELFANVTNLFDKDPPIFNRAPQPTLAYPTIPALYDTIGRYFVVGVRLKF